MTGSTGNNPGHIPDEDSETEIKPVWHRGRVAMLATGGGLLLLIVLSVFACQPRKGTILYGVCSALLEQNLPYPETIRRTAVEQYPNSVRVYFTNVDAFGQFKLEMIECSFRMNAQDTLMIDKALYNRRAMDQAVIDKFNPSIPAIIASEPDLTLPPPLASALEGLKQD